MRNLLAAALDPTPTSPSRDRVTRSFWSTQVGGATEPVELSARREARKSQVADDASLHFLFEE